MHASPGPFFTCARSCTLAEGCKNEPQHVGIRACISGSVLHLSPQVCTCRRLQKRTAARRCKIMHFRVRSSPVPGGVHLQKAAKNEQQHAGFHLSCSLMGDGVRGVCPCGNGKCKDFAATPVVACVQMGEASKTRNATTKARISNAASIHVSPEAVRAEPGPAAAIQSSSADDNAPFLPGAILDVANDDASTLSLWERALVSVDDADRLASAPELVLTMLLCRPIRCPGAPRHAGTGHALLACTRGHVRSDPTRLRAVERLRPIFLVLLLSCSLSLGSRCPRRLLACRHHLPGWIRLLLLRLDRPEHCLCGCDLPFVATLFSTRHKRALLQAVRAKIETPAWQTTVARLAQRKATDFLQVFHVCKTLGGFPRLFVPRASPST